MFQTINQNSSTPNLQQFFPMPTFSTHQAAAEQPAKCRMGSPRSRAILPPPGDLPPGSEHMLFTFHRCLEAIRRHSADVAEPPPHVAPRLPATYLTWRLPKITKIAKQMAGKSPFLWSFIMVVYSSFYSSIAR